MTTPVTVSIYKAVDTNGECACEFDHSDTPAGQRKGIAGDECTKTPTETDPTGTGNS